MARQEGGRRRRRGDSDDDFEVELEKTGPASGGMRMQSSPHIGVTKVSRHAAYVLHTLSNRTAITMKRHAPVLGSGGEHHQA